MKFIEPSVEYWQQGAGMEGVWNQIARATRVCYQSKPREGESGEDFVKRIILKPALIKGNLNDLEHCKFNFGKMHGAMLEHGTVYITVPPYIEDGQISTKAFTTLIINKYSKVNTINNWDYITTNLRVLFEENILDCLKYITEPTEYHIKRCTFSVITDIGVTREFNRHRTFSIAEQSTRYCDLTKDKFGSEITYIIPTWITDINADDLSLHTFLSCCKEAEATYQNLRLAGWKPEQARKVLPLGLKTQAVYTAFNDDWKHFLKLRADNVSGRVHPNMEIIAKQIKEIGVKEGLWK